MRTFASMAVWLLLTSCATSNQSADVAEGERSWGDALGSQITDAWSAPEYRAFDFWIGEWAMNWREQPEGEFYHQKEGTWTHERVFPILDGKAIVELGWDVDNPEEASQRGFSIRYFDPARERWVMAQNWPNQANQGLAQVDQLIGPEHLGRLSMYSVTRRRHPDGTVTPEHRRYNFTDIRPGVSFRWDGSNTPDNGATWYTWTVIDALREADLEPYGEAGSAFPGVHNRILCQDPLYRAYDGLQGVWVGEATRADGASSRAVLSAGVMLDGCSIAAALETDARRVFMTYSYAAPFSRWVNFRLDDQPGTTHSYLVSETSGGTAVYEEAPALAIQDEFTPYAIPEAFETRDARVRTVWEAMNDRELIFREEERASASAPWSLKTRFHLVRANTE